MPFLTLSGADVDFLGRELRWRTYTTQEALPTTRRVELVGKKEFAAAALVPEHETFVVHVASLTSSAGVHPSRRPQRAGLIAEEAPTKVPVEYANFADVFSLDLAFELPEHTGINSHPIGLVDNLPSHPPALQYLSPKRRTIAFDFASKGLNNLTMKNRYPLPLIKALPFWLKCQF